MDLPDGVAQGVLRSQQCLVAELHQRKEGQPPVTLVLPQKAYFAFEDAVQQRVSLRQNEERRASGFRQVLGWAMHTRLWH